MMQPALVRLTMKKPGFALQFDSKRMTLLPESERKTTLFEFIMTLDEVEREKAEAVPRPSTNP